MPLLFNGFVDGSSCVPFQSARTLHASRDLMQYQSDEMWLWFQERREIENALFTGKLWAVAATNALELGVDVGSLDATLHLGFPGGFLR